MADQGAGDAPPRNPNDSGAQDSPITRAMVFLKRNPMDTFTWLTRLITIFYGIAFILPFFGGQPYTSFQKCLISGAATSALRLHQRMPTFRLTREFFTQLALEDSFHYLMYCIMFIFTHPVSVALAPVFLFAVLHATQFTSNFLIELNPDGFVLLRRGINKISTNTPFLLRFIALNEILLMPIIIVSLFTGSGSLILPFVYYRFLCLRYTSRRNVNSRLAWYQLRVACYQATSSPSCPAFVGRAVDSAIQFISRMAPQIQA